MYKLGKSDIKLINKMAIPLLASSIVQAIFTLSDQAIMGHTNIEGYAAVGIVSNILYILTGTIGILSLSFSILFGKAIGESNKEKAANLFNTSINFSILVGCIFGVISLLFSNSFFSILYNFTGDTLAYANQYMYIASWGLGLNMILFIFSAYFKNLKKTTFYFYSTIISLLVNFIVDYTLVFGKFGFPKLGVKGAAIGTIAGLIVNLCIYIYWFIKSDYVQYKFSVYKKELKQLVKIYIPLLGQDFIESTLFVLIITSIITHLNVYHIATYNLFESINNIILLPVYAYSGVALTLVTQSYSKGDMEKARNYPIVSIICSVSILIIICGIFILFRMKLFRLLTNDTNLIQTASTILPLVISIQLLNPINQVFKYCLQGISCEKWVLNYSLIISIISCIIIYLFVKVFKMNIYGVYLGLGLNYLLLSIGYCIKYFYKIKKSVY